jgi:hypothetical protein
MGDVLTTAKAAAEAWQNPKTSVSRKNPLTAPFASLSNYTGIEANLAQYLLRGKQHFT